MPRYIPLEPGTRVVLHCPGYPSHGHTATVLVYDPLGLEDGRDPRVCKEAPYVVKLDRPVKFPVQVCYGERWMFETDSGRVGVNTVKLLLEESVDG